ACGGSVTVTFTATSDCQTVTQTATFTVTDAPALTRTDHADQTIAACTPQAQIQTQYDAWLQSVVTSGATGGCNTVVTHDAPATAPAACGGSVTVTFTATSDCQTVTQTATFTVTDATALTLTDPADQTIAACTPQAQIQTQYDAWLQSVVTSGATGGCNTVVTHDAPATAPAACGGSVTVTFTATSDCQTVTQTATFTVTDATALTLTDPADQTIAACTPQAQIQTQYDAWLQSVVTSGATGGCNTVVTHDAPATAPAACGGSVTVTFTATSDCQTVTQTATFTVTDAPALTLTDPADQTIAACTPQAQIQTQYDAWLQSVVTSGATGGCNTVVTHDAPATAPAACGGSVTVTFTATSDCQTVTQTATFTVTDAPALTLTDPADQTIAACTPQ